MRYVAGQRVLQLFGGVFGCTAEAVFVFEGIMSLTQAATIIYGANIGTTVTAQIVALGMFGGASTISTTIIFSAFAGIGAFLALFARCFRRRTR